MYKQLKSLYEKNSIKIREVRDTFPDDDLEGPFLIYPCEEYLNSKIKMMIIGQQTNGWECNVNDFDEQLFCYDGFDLGRNYNSSPFWNIYHKLERSILNKDYCTVWGNVNKYDLECDKPYGEYENKISELDYILKDEINILKPNIIIFICGYTFDERIENIYKQANFKTVFDWTFNQMVKIEHSDLPEHTYRTYHPKYLRMSKLENRIINTLSNIIKT